MEKGCTNDVGEENISEIKDMLSCYQCSYTWKCRNRSKLPKNCPCCRSTVWMRPFEERSCTRCGHSWRSTKETSKRCPICGTYRWNDEPVVHNCIKCGHRWNAKRGWSPKRCPKCRSTTWKEKTNVRAKDKAKMQETKRQAHISTISKQNSDAVMDMYKGGHTCTSISLNTGIPFSIVYEIVSTNTDSPKI